MADKKISAATSTTPARTDLIPLERPADATARQTSFGTLFETIAASATARGGIELATTAEAQAGTDTVRAVTPEGLAEYFNQTVPIDNDGAFQWELARSGGGKFTIDLGGAEFDGTFDDVVCIGFNMLGTGSRIDTDLAGFSTFMEYDFYDSGVHQSEWQVRFTTDSGTNYRPVQFNCAWDYSSAYWWFRIGSGGSSMFRVDNADTAQGYLIIDAVNNYTLMDINGIYLTGTSGGGSGIFIATQYSNDIRLGTNNTIRVTIPAAVDGFTFGSGQDTNLYRSAANTLKTDDDLLFTANKGVILVDRSDGHTYRLKTDGGSLGVEVVT